MAGVAPVLVTGFEPFGGEQVNASWEAVRLLPGSIAGHPVERLLLPVEFGRSGDLLVEALRAHRPAAAICVGEAGGRAHLSVERFAVNLMDARMADNAGLAPHEEEVVPGGPVAYAATLDVSACARAAREAGMPAEPSETAGLYVCNQLMYRLLHELATTGRHIPATFVHVPYTPQQAAARKNMAFSPSALCATGIEAIMSKILC